ncbi:PadR family transcriptional regulator [Deinococcus roseus]|uniref:PadR family transcriptional regulator n=1 Tax=Deinococcus roseus TaxID=392414 RepID=A0ABQ2CZX3_9DEIO|nr:PadR family transcriptional regulator [Deinococcus roseus]GGJ26153.1 PadR family transcriptional regulator [Deinococcus roseus]
MIEQIVLGFLMLRSMTLYDIKKGMEKSTEHFSSASFGSLHPTVQRLEKQNLIESQEETVGGRNRKRYTLTDAGKQHFLNWLGQDIELEKVKDNSLLKLFFLGHLPADQAKTLIERYCKHLEQQIALLGLLHDQTEKIQVPESLQRIKDHQVATLEFGKAYYQFAREWYMKKFLENS